MTSHIIRVFQSIIRGKGLRAVLASQLLWQVSADTAQSCACCADPADRHVATVPLDDYLGSELKYMKFSNQAATYTNACGFDCVIGIDDPQDFYHLDVDATGDRWALGFSTSDGHRGDISFALPADAFEFFVDTTPGSNMRGATLYKELRMEVQPQGTGIFAAGLTGQPRAMLILHGKGNHCTSAQDFTNWQFRIETDAARYVLFGVLDAIE